MTRGFWQGRRLFVTGHTGFKGSWLSLWLRELGARVHGYALAPPTSPSLFEVANVEADLAAHTLGDIRDRQSLSQALNSSGAELVIHMAAQPLVRLSYQDPVSTYDINVLGTVQVLDAVRACSTVRAVLVVTSDKCYENHEWLWGYRETEALGGSDPYSSSKACTELVTAAYRSSFLADQGVAVASARAGNVIGGGDWAVDRLLPDFFRAADAGQMLEVRYPHSTRPWQHVLVPLSGYLELAAALLEHGSQFAEPWNFGPAESEARSVKWVLEYLTQRVAGSHWRHTGAQQPHEARSLRLDSTKANVILGWSPVWSLQSALDRTIEWHSHWRRGADMHGVCLDQIRDFETQRGH